MVFSDPLHAVVLLDVPGHLIGNLDQSKAAESPSRARSHLLINLVE
jgi:hypothetical protein